MRACGCDWDTRVFGHAYCWQQPWPRGQHITCRCHNCDCHCHGRT